ncbi:NAD(P)-dependent oxidoreductase [Sutterella sp.]|uniref:NAD(P)-dependent oxidoreductase n=1 Tax=Sutterella sp. TaxID=1981025 RepID=UPI0026E00644|nr:NAD(P)H-binding protein [Sutterella sp.]MDO5532544.1 NAD(P)H-binding protein [Sutterella sp.]
MKKIAVIGANGKAGSLITAEAVARGFDVTAIVRGENRSAAPKAIIRDVLDVTLTDLQGLDAVVLAIGVWTPEAMPLHRKAALHLAELLGGTDTRLVVVSGAGSLYVNPEHTLQLVDTPEFPEAYKPVANGMRAQYDALREQEDLDWLCVSPAAVFLPDGPRTGKYVLTDSNFSVNAEGKSEVSYADYAIGFVDELEKAEHHRELVSIRW